MKFINIIFLKIIISVLLTLNITTNNTYAFSEIVFDPISIIQTTITAVSAPLTQASTYVSSLLELNADLKEFISDPLAFSIASSAIANIKEQLSLWM